MTARAPQAETVVSMPILNPETKGKSRSFTYMGKVDLVEPGKIVDWKGVDSIDRFRQERRISFQGELYALALEATGVQINEIEYRLITRPTIGYKRPKYTYAIVRPNRKTAVGVFDSRAEALGSDKVKSGDTIEERVRGNPTRNHFEVECVDWLIEDGSRVGTYPYILTESKKQAARDFLWDAAKRILEARRHARWLPSTKACYAWGRPCSYLDLCDALQNDADWRGIVAERYRHVASSHPELEGADDGKDVLTFSSISDLTLCEMLYLWKHEERLRLGAEGTAESAWIGSAMHRGLEAYARGGPVEANEAIAQWADECPVLGEDMAWKQNEQVAKAGAMVQVAARRWSIKVAVADEPLPKPVDHGPPPTGDEIPF